MIKAVRLVVFVLVGYCCLCAAATLVGQRSYAQVWGVCQDFFTDYAGCDRLFCEASPEKEEILGTNGDGRKSPALSYLNCTPLQPPAGDHCSTENEIWVPQDDPTCCSSVGEECYSDEHCCGFPPTACFSSNVCGICGSSCSDSSCQDYDFCTCNPNAYGCSCHCKPYGTDCLADSDCQSPLVCDPNYLTCRYRPDYGCGCRTEGQECMDDSDCTSDLYCDWFWGVCLWQ